VSRKYGVECNTQPTSDEDLTTTSKQVQAYSNAFTCYEEDSL